MPHSQSKAIETPAVDYRVRRGAISAYGRALDSSFTLKWLIWTSATASCLLLLGLLLLAPESTSMGYKAGLLAAIALVGSGFGIVCYYSKRHFIEPDLAFRKWLQQVCDGDLNARINLPETHRHYKELDFHTRNLATALMQLSTEMENLVETQTHTLEEQKKVLTLLFKLTSDVAHEIDKKEVIKTVARYLVQWYGNATVYGYLSDERRLECIAGFRAEPENEVSRVDTALADPLGLDDLVQTITIIERSGQTHPVEAHVPIKTAQAPVGMLVIKTDSVEAMKRKESERVLRTVSEQLSMFMTKQLAADQAISARTMIERTAMAAEIHDSLSQTLLASRYQVALLRESLSNESSQQWYADVLKLENAIGVANKEVRDLIHEYRSPITDHRNVEALRDVIDRFRQSSDMEVFFQCEDPSIQFTADEQAVIHRIVSESLTNAQKYSKANMIRVYLQGSRRGIRVVLVEDDGVGFVQDTTDGSGDGLDGVVEDHFGMSIMNERALSIGAVLSIESEEGEGTRLSLKLPPYVVQ